MKFTNEADVNGTSLQGYVQAYYHQLVEVFGHTARPILHETPLE